jgi:hypothetical protein
MVHVRFRGPRGWVHSAKGNIARTTYFFTFNSLFSFDHDVILNAHTNREDCVQWERKKLDVGA